MLRPLLYLSALITLAGKRPESVETSHLFHWLLMLDRFPPAGGQCFLVSIHQSAPYVSSMSSGAQQTFKASSEFDISSCPITIYGQTYQHVYVNLTSKNLVVCFNSFYSPGTKDDCIFGPLTDSDSAEFEKYQRIPILETIVKYSVPTIKTRMDCYFSFSYQHNKGYVVDVQVDGTSADQVEVTNTPTSRQTRVYLDISGCRHSGWLRFPWNWNICGFIGSERLAFCPQVLCINLPHSCIPAVLYDAIFNPKLDLVCTVTGPALIDFQGHVTSVKDRCTYSLLSIPSVPGLQVLANFQERRRKDVSFLDSVTLWLDRLGVHIHLKQSGRVLVDDSTLTLSSSVQMVHGVELSQDLTGVTAKLSLSNFTVSVFFDGYTVQIHLQGPENPTSLLGICNFLKEAPFSSCDIDPEPYITACTDTLCSYPDLDALKCQFLEAYARTCRLKHNATLDGWRSKSELDFSSEWSKCFILQSNNNQIIYQNTISNDNGFSNVITRRDQVFINFSCIYLQEATKAFKIRSSSVIKVITSAVWNYTLTMNAYTDAARTQPVESNTEVWLDQKIWVELKTDGLDGDLISMVTKSCWATNQESDNGSLRYDLIKNGCANPADPTVT
ncbi:hypothetical protein GOODEAATRI_013126, partial [Goodea atripinnis]